MQLIALTAKAHAGKDTAANALIADGWTLMRFATEMKDMLRHLLRMRGCRREQIEYWIEGDGKILACPYLGGKTPRWAMQSMGTEWGRNCMGETFWIDSAMQDVDFNGRYPSARMVFLDLRFPNEAEAIRAKGGFVIQIVRLRRDASGNPSDTHASEMDMDGIKPDMIVYNSGTIADLHRNIRGTVNDLYGKTNFEPPKNYHMALPAHPNAPEYPAPQMDSVRKFVSQYGFCPECYSPGVVRERSPNGLTTCSAGHKFPHGKFLPRHPRNT